MSVELAALEARTARQGPGGEAARQVADRSRSLPSRAAAGKYQGCG